MPVVGAPGQMSSGVESAEILLAFSIKKCTTKQHTTEEVPCSINFKPKAQINVHYFHSKMSLPR